MSTRVPWARKDRPKPPWLCRPPPDTRNGRIAHKYWNKIWTQQPLWANRDKMKTIYAEAERQRASGRAVHVDHVVPLAGELVCGLHWEGNLEVITTKANYEKSNHIWPGMPMEPQALPIECEPHQTRMTLHNGE